jgi:methionyl-tRNA formyltransferase
VARIAVAATAPFGADILARLAEERDIVFCLTRPDRRAGRGQRLRPSPAKIAAEDLGIPVLQPEALDETVELPADTIVVCAYGVFVPEGLLGRQLWLNVHPSLLPRWRGAAPVERAIMAGDAETGVTIIRLAQELDAGPIAAQHAFPIASEDDAGAVYAKAGVVAAELLNSVLDGASFRAQPSAGATYAHKIGAEDRTLDLTRPAAELIRQVRALSPHIGARAVLDGRPVTIWRATVVDGRLVPEEVQPDGGRRMPYDAFLRGLRR